MPFWLVGCDQKSKAYEPCNLHDANKALLPDNFSAALQNCRRARRYDKKGSESCRHFLTF